MADFTIVAIDAEQTADHYDEVADRATHAQPAFSDVMRLMEQAHRRHFDRLRGRYVLTGATQASLTQPVANGAIRHAHQGGMTFGTAVPQAHYLTKAPRDPDSGQVPKPSGEGRSAVLVLSRETKQRAARIIADFVTEPFGA